MYLIALGFSMLCLFGVGFYFVRSSAFSLFHPMTFYLAFHGLLFVVRPLLMYLSGNDEMYRAYEFTPSLSDKITVIVASNLGFLVFSLFCLRFGNLPMRFTQNAAIDEERARLSRLFWWVLILLGPLVLYSIYRSFGEDSLYSGMVMDRNTGVAINTNNVGYLLDLQTMAVSLTAILAWLLRFRLLSMMPMALFVVFRAGQGGRGPFVIALVAAGLFYLYDKRLKTPRLRVLLGAALVVSAFNMIGADRGAMLRQTIGLQQKDSVIQAQKDREFFLYGMDFANMEFFEYLVYAIPQRSGTYDYFMDNLQVFTEPIPRAWWSGKPVGEPLRRIDLYRYGFPIGMTRSLPGEGWYALGWLGVAIWCGLWGACLGRIYRSFVLKPQTPMRVAFYLVFLPSLIVTFRDGTVLTLARTTGAYFTPIVIWYLFARLVGVPKASELAAWRLHSGQAGPAERAARLNTLPAAVRRRRLALAQDRALPTAE